MCIQAEKFEIGDRVKTNQKCDFKNVTGVITQKSDEGHCLIVKLDTGITIMTMFYAVDKIPKFKVFK